MHFSSIEFSVESEKTDSVHIFNTSGFFRIFLTYYKLWLSQTLAKTILLNVSFWLFWIYKTNRDWWRDKFKILNVCPHYEVIRMTNDLREKSHEDFPKLENSSKPTCNCNTDI